MKVVNLSEQNTVMNRFLAEIRDTEYQKNRLLFRNNIERIGMCMAYEISRELNYETVNVTTPLGEAPVAVPSDPMVVATVLRAGLPFHEGFLAFFDHAESAFISAFRMYKNREHTEVGVHTEYIASPSVEGKTLLIVDPMLATGGSMAAAYEAFLGTGKPKCVHIACVIGTEEGISVVRQAVGDADVTVWCAAIDPEMNDHKYIVPGFGDCGDLCFGPKL
ncbi:MAG: uracil phosphoribosyltransferase [Prevotella sp.]|nr:uracil phosphoribosyltransferase [Prevotella sp.]